MEKGKLQFMNIKEMLVSINRNDFKKTSFTKMCEYSEKETNESCVVFMKCSSKERPDGIRAFVMIEVPRKSKKPKLGTPYSKFKVRDIMFDEETDWLCFEKTDTYDDPKDERTSYRYTHHTDDFWEMIADIDDYFFGDVINGDALVQLMKSDAKQ